MKNNKGRSHILLSICTIIIILVTIIGVRTFIKQKSNMEIEDISTDMLILKGKVQVISQENIIKKDERPLVGKKLSENLENEKVKNLIDQGIIKEDEEDFESYYIIDEENMQELNLKNNLEEGNFYIVNYTTYEIIISNGFNIEGNTIYTLTDILEQKNTIMRNNKEEIKTNSETNTETQEEVEE